MSYAIRIDGLGFRAVENEDAVGTDEFFSEEPLLNSEVAKQCKTNVTAREYLASTDWYVIRWQETGGEIPKYIKDARATARASVV